MLLFWVGVFLLFLSVFFFLGGGFLVVCVLVLGGSGFVFYIDLCFSLQ